MSDVVEKIKENLATAENTIEAWKEEAEQTESKISVICNPLIVQAYHRGLRDNNRNVLMLLKSKVVVEKEAIQNYMDNIESLTKTIHNFEREREKYKPKLWELADLLKNRPRFTHLHGWIDSHGVSYANYDVDSYIEKIQLKIEELLKEGEKP